MTYLILLRISDGIELVPETPRFRVPDPSLDRNGRTRKPDLGLRQVEKGFFFIFSQIFTMIGEFLK